MLIIELLLVDQLLLSDQCYLLYLCFHPSLFPVLVWVSVQLVTMWGVWNSVASSLLEGSGNNYLESGSSEQSTALEACTAMSYLYGLLPVVMLDVVLPSR